MQTVLPKNLNYSDVKPIGFPSHVRIEKFTPVAFNSVSTSDLIRFNISSNGFWDPYTAYIKMEVDISGDTSGSKAASTTIFGSSVPASGGQAVGCQQVDNSASSFINQLIIWKGGTEIERIEEYDTLAAVLNDMAYNTSEKGSRYGEGQGSIETLQDGIFGNKKTLVTVGTNLQQHGFVPGEPQSPGVSTSIVSYSSAMGGGTGFSGGSSFLYRYEWGFASFGQDTIQKVTSNNVIGSGSVAQPGGINQFVSNASVTGSVNASGVNFGLTTPFSPYLSGCSGEVVLSNNYTIQSTYKGKLWNPTLRNKATFCIPIISGIFGILMPQESYKYVPMRPLQDLILEFRLNPYAMFTSGYNDPVLGWIATSPAMTTFSQLKRTWQITKFEINVEMQYFESDVENIILSQLNTEKGIVLHTQSWLLGPRYSLAPNTTASGNYQVNLGFESLKNVIFMFIPDEYQTYSFCRKQYRLSEQITSLQVKIGQQYYPPLPITGHGGTPIAYNAQFDSNANNSEFLIQLYKCFGKYNDINKDCYVNPINFAVNERGFDPTNTQPLIVTSSFANYDTAQSQPLWHENRCVGRAIYALNLETLNNDFSVISGMNTINNRPFEIILKSENTYAYPRSRTMVVFCQYDMLLQLRSSGIQILGRG